MLRHPEDIVVADPPHPAAPGVSPALEFFSRSTPPQLLNVRGVLLIGADDREIRAPGKTRRRTVLGAGALDAGARVYCSDRASAHRASAMSRLRHASARL
jgi:hypothetical protein